MIIMHLHSHAIHDSPTLTNNYQIEPTSSQPGSDDFTNWNLIKKLEAL